MMQLLGPFLFQAFPLNLTLSCRRPISYRNQSIDLLPKSMDWFLYDIGLHHERIKQFVIVLQHKVHAL